MPNPKSLRLFPAILGWRTERGAVALVVQSILARSLLPPLRAASGCAGARVAGDAPDAPKPLGMLRAVGFCQALSCTQKVSVPWGPAPKGAFGLALRGIPIPRVGVPGGKGLTAPDLLRSPPGTLLGLSPAPRCTPQGLTPLGLFKHLQLR